MWYVSFSHFSYRMPPLVCNLSIRTGYLTLLTHTAESVEAFFFFETEGRQTQPTPNELRVCGSQSAIETLTLSPLLFHIYINISIYIYKHRRSTSWLQSQGDAPPESLGRFTAAPSKGLENSRDYCMWIS